MKDIKERKIAIIGAGASGCLCAYFLLKHGFDVTLYDRHPPLTTLLPTGGGRCNLAYAEFNSKLLAENYPRGEKFLYSVFSKFSTTDTLKVFEELGVNTYTQDNGRIFPVSNSAEDVRQIILKKLNLLGVTFIKGEVSEIIKTPDCFVVITKSGRTEYSDVIIAIGGKSGLKLVENFGIKTNSQKPSLVGLKTREDLSSLSGTVVKGARALTLKDDLLFTHFGISGPLTYSVSALNAFNIVPYKLTIDLAPNLPELQDLFNKNPHKDIKNILKEFLPIKVVSYILRNITELPKACIINKQTRDLINSKIHNFELTVIGTNKGEETVSAGGICLDEVNPKTMEIKKVPHLYCIGEILDIDGFCGGFNLQNAWSTAYVCANGIINN